MNNITKACVAGALAAAALIGVAKHANASGILAYAPNNSGGTIQISDEPCKSGDGKLALIINASGEPVLGGCWQWIEPNIAVTWNTGDVRMYTADAWTFTDYAKTQVTKTPQKRRSSM